MYMNINLRNYDILPTIYPNYDPFRTTSNFFSINNRKDRL